LKVKNALEKSVYYIMEHTLGILLRDLNSNFFSHLC